MRFAFSRGWFDWGNPPHPWLTVQQWLTEILPELSNGLSNRRFHQLESRDIGFRRVLILCIKPSTRNRVSWKAINSYLYYLSKKPGFSSPQLTPIIRNRVSWKAPKSYLYYAPKKPGFSSRQKPGFFSRLLMHAILDKLINAQIKAVWLMLSDRWLN